MDVILVGPGRAGQALSLRFVSSGHRVVGVLGRSPDRAAEAAAALGAPVLNWDAPLPPSDLVVIAVRDDAIAVVAARLAGKVGDVGSAVHLSGLKPVNALGALEGIRLGSFHPLQTLPTPEIGAARLEGAWVAVTTPHDALAESLFSLARSIGTRPFALEDSVKPLYHAAAAAAANYTLGALAMSQRLFDAAGVSFEVAEPLVGAVVANAMEIGPVSALTGPIARGDVGTVAAQIEAIEGAVPDLVDPFKALGRIVALTAGTMGVMEEVLT